MKLIATLVVLVFLAISAGTARANANCIYNGRSYPTGTNINGLVCQPDGTWR